MNTSSLIGRLTKDPRIRWTNEGLCVAEFTLAIDRPPNRNGEKVTDFPQCTAFGKNAENMEKYVGKGQMIGVTGSIQTGSYEHKDGYTVYTTKVAVQKLDIIEWKNSRFESQNDADGQMGREAQENGGEVAKTSSQSNMWKELDEDIPL